MWASTAISFLFLPVRGYYRIKRFNRLFFDDALVLLAWICLFITAVIWQTRVWIVYYVWNVSDGKVYPPPANFFELVDKQVHQGLAVTFMNIVSLWSVKFAFLVLFRRMSRNVRGFDLLWWAVFLFTVATLAVCVGVQAYDCTFGEIMKISSECIQYWFLKLKAVY